MALRVLGWDVLRAIEAFPERTKDTAHFEEAARLGRVLVSNDEDQLLLALQWLKQGRRFAGLITWPQRHYDRITVGQIVEAFEGLAARDEPFAGYPIIHIKPKARMPPV